MKNDEEGAGSGAAGPPSRWGLRITPVSHFPSKRESGILSPRDVDSGDSEEDLEREWFWLGSIPLASLSAALGIIMALIGSLIDLLDGRDSRNIPISGQVLVALVAASVFFDTAMYRFAYSIGRYRPSYRLWVAETLEAFALVAFVAGTVLHLRDRRMRLEHGPHSACSLEDAVTAWAQRTGIIAYGVLVLPLLKCVAAAYRMEAGAKRQEPWARLFLSQSRRQAILWGGLASVALDVVVAQSLLAGDVPQIVADARAIGALAGGVAGAAATHGVENDAVRDMAEGVAEGMATSLRCLVPGKVQLGPASGAQTGPMWVESAIGGGDAEGSAVAVAGAVIVPVTFECASSLAHRDVWVKVVMGALVALVICLAAVATHRGALPKVVSSVRRIVRVAGYLDAQGMVVLPGTPLQSAAPPRTLQDAAARLTSAIQLLVKTVFRSGTVMRRVLDNAREVNLPGDAGLLEMYGIEELSPAAPLPDVTRNRGSLHTVEDDFTFGDLVSKPLLAAPQGRSTDQSAKEGGVAFRGKATSMPQGPDAAGPQRRSGTRVRMSLGSLLSSRAKRGVSVDVRESAADSGKTQPSRIADEVVEKTVVSETRQPANHDAEQLLPFFTGLGTPSWNSLGAPPKALELAVAEMFWRLGLLQGISPIHHLAQLRSKLTGAPSLQARSAAEGIYVVSRERLAAFIAEAQKRYNDNPYHRWEHAVDVTHSVYVFLRRARGFRRKYLGKRELFCMMVAALAHDMGHRGVTNGHLVKTRDVLAITYNDRSVQEMMHASTLFQLCESTPEANVFEGLPVEELDYCRKLIVELILDTDMASHFARVGELEALWNRISAEENLGDLMGGKEPQVRLEAVKSMVDDVVSAYKYEPEDARQLMMAILHAADLGSCLKPVPLHAMWSVQVLEEFFNEARLEKEIGMRPLPFMDPEQCYVPTSQMDFLSFVCLPLFRVIFGLLPELSTFRTALSDNYVFWARMVSADQTARGAGGNASPLASPGVDPQTSSSLELRSLLDVIKARLAGMGTKITEATMAMDIASKVKTFHAALDRGMQ